jgi:hypothetical protein
VMMADGLAAHIDRELANERLRDSVIDLDIVVDDARRDVDAALDRLRAAVRDRDAALRELLEAIEAPEAA